MAISRLLVLALSLTAGGGAAWLTTSGAPEPAQPVVAAPAGAEVALDEVLVAAVDLGQRRRLTAADLKWQAWPQDTLLDGFITRTARPDAVEEMSGNLVRVAMLAGEPIRREKVSATDNGYLSALLSPGKRAVSVKVTAESTAGGFILPEDRVDVLHTIVPDGATGGVTRTIVTNVRVVAVDQQVAAPETNAVAAAKTATLELEPAQAEIVAAAEASGSLSLALRSSADNGEVQLVSYETRQRTVHIISGGESHVAKTN